MLPFYIVTHIEWLALAILVASTVHWLIKGPKDAPYTAAWWALAILLGVFALYRKARLGV